MNSELPEEAIDELESAQKSLHEGFYKDTAGKVNMKQMNQRIFWFVPEIPAMKEFRPIPAHLAKSISYYSES